MKHTITPEEINAMRSIINRVQTSESNTPSQRADHIIEEIKDLCKELTNEDKISFGIEVRKLLDASIEEYRPRVRTEFLKSIEDLGDPRESVSINMKDTTNFYGYEDSDLQTKKMEREIQSENPIEFKTPEDYVSDMNEYIVKDGIKNLQLSIGYSENEKILRTILGVITAQQKLIEGLNNASK